MESYDAPVLLLVPTGRDGSVASAILREVSIGSEVCTELGDLVAKLGAASCAVVTEEALLNADRSSLAEWLARQPAWSDLPFVLLTFRGDTPAEHLIDLLGNVTVLERPFHPTVLVNAVKSAVRARHRQREVETHLKEREQTHERQELLIRELHHRVKNTLATVQGLLGATARTARSIDDFHHSFVDRIVSLGRTHNLLTEDYWQTASLIELLRNELGHYDSATKRRIVLAGPQVELSADLAVPVGMAVHELTTNAAKYGALSVSSGSIEVLWKVGKVEAGRKLCIDWTERGGPPVKQPRRKGFGSTLLHRVLAAQCGAEIEIAYEREGLHCRINIPLTEKSRPVEPTLHPAA